MRWRTLLTLPVSTSLRSHLVTLVVLGLVPVLVFCVALVLLLDGEERAALERGLRDTARALGAAVDRVLIGDITALHALAASQHLDAGNLAAFYAEAARVRDSQHEWLTVLLTLPSGGQLINTLLPREASLPEPVERESFLHAVATGRPVVGNVVKGPISGRFGAPIRVPVFREGALKYVLTAVVTREAMQDVLASQKLPADWIGMVLDGKQVIVARTHDAERLVGTPALMLSGPGTEGPEGWVKGRNPDGTLTYVAYARSSFSRWSVALAVPATLIEGSLKRSLWTVAGVGLLCVLVGAWAASHWGRRIARPLAALSASAEALGRGDTPVVPASPVLEIDNVARAIESAAAERRTTEATLRETNNALRALIHASPLGIVALDPDLNVTMWNPAAERIFGWTEPEVLGRRYPLVPDDRQDEFRHQYQVVLRGGAFSGFETRRGRKDGSPIDVNISVAPLHDANGRIRAIMVLLADISDRKRADDERERLLVREQAARTEADRQRREAEVLAELARAINTSLDLDAILERVTQGARTACGGDRAHVSLRDPESGDLVVRYQVGAHQPLVGQLRIEPGKGRAGHVLVTGRPSRTDSSAGDPRRGHGDPVEAEAQEVVAELAVPIAIDGQVEGVLCVDNRTARPFTERDEAVLLRLAEYAAIAIRNARLFAREQAARADAERASRAKDEFLAMLGHELRNPLGAISSAVTVLDQLAGPDDRTEKPRTIIGRQSRHLARLIEDLLDVSRVTLGKIELQRRPVDLKNVVERCLGAHHRPGRPAHHDIVLTGDAVLVEGDRTRLEQIVGNLLDNAVKYTPAGGQIRLSVKAEGNEAVLQVRDTGIGIARETLPHIFDLFVQADRSLERSKGGLSLGLTLVKRLVELHGGTVSASSPGIGQGSEFMIRLPLLRERPRIDAPAQDSYRIGSRRVLVVEDHQDARDGLRILLELGGHQVEEAEDGVSGLEKVLALRPDIALIDVGLPGLDGYAVARAVRAAPNTRTVFLVAMTGYGLPGDRQRSKRASMPTSSSRLTRGPSCRSWACLAGPTAGPKTPSRAAGLARGPPEGAGGPPRMGAKIGVAHAPRHRLPH